MSSFKAFVNFPGKTVLLGEGCAGNLLMYPVVLTKISPVCLIALG